MKSMRVRCSARGLADNQRNSIAAESTGVIYSSDIKPLVAMRSARVGYRRRARRGVNKPATEARSGVNPFTKNRWSSQLSRPASRSKRR